MCVKNNILAQTMPDAGGDIAGGSCGGACGAGGGAGVRVRLNLGQFFSDERARAYMWAPRGRRVRWLVRRVARVFALPGPLALASHGHVLPAAEPLLLLERDDPVEVIRVSNTAVVYDNASDSSVSDADDAAPTAAAPHDDADELRLLKRRALRLLDEQCALHSPAPAPALAPACSYSPASFPAKRARRRRRRRAPAAAEAEAAKEVAEEAAEGAVVRSGAGARPPRLVRALSPAAPHDAPVL